MDTIIIPIPEGHTKLALFESLATMNSYSNTIIEKQHKSIILPDEATANDYLGNFDGVTKILVKPTKNHDGTFTFDYTDVVEVPNPVTKEQHGKSILGSQLKQLFTEVVKYDSLKIIEEQKTVIEQQVEAAITFEGLEIT